MELEKYSVEEIYEIDTITLEEYIEELELQKDITGFQKKYLKLARVELWERIKVEQFGMDLMREPQQQSFDINFDAVRLPKIQCGKPELSTLETESFNQFSCFQRNIGSKSAQGVNLKKQLLKKLKGKMVGVENCTVGQPLFNHRYVEPKKKSLLSSRPTQSTSQVKMKTSVSMAAKKPRPSEYLLKSQTSRPVAEHASRRKPQVSASTDRGRFQKQPQREKLQLERVVFAAEDSTAQKISLRKDAQADETNQRSGQETELKHAKSKTTEDIEYVENDVYEDQPEQFQEKMQLSERMLDEVTEENFSSIKPLIEQESNQRIEVLEEIEEHVEPNEQQSAGTAEEVTFQRDCSVKETPFQEKETSPPAVIVNQQSPSLINGSQNQSQQEIYDFEKKRSQSVKEIRQASFQVQKSPQVDSIAEDQCQLFIKADMSKTKPKVSHINATERLPALNQASKTKTSVNFYGKTLGQLQVKKVSYDYSDCVESFSNLFPHSKNILITLKNIQRSLGDHFQKDISRVAKQSDFLSVSVEEIEFKIVTQLENQSKYKHKFDIELKSFERRSMMMLKRLKKQLPKECSTNQNRNLFYRVVRTKQEVYDIINSCFYRTENWYELPHGLELKSSWNLLWTWSKPQIDFNDLFVFQKVNHFIGNKQIARKDLLKKNIEKIKKYSKKLNRYFDIIPETFFLPGENSAFIKKFRECENQRQNVWILKPVGMSRGRGIELVEKLEEVVFSEPIVMQKYLDRPLLMDGFKFDLRIYVLVTSINPLECFIYKEGFARVSTQQYCNHSNELQNKYVHLTNYSIQKETFATPLSFTQEETRIGGCKLTLKMLREKLQSRGVEWPQIWEQVKEVVVKSLVACMNAIPHNPNCFQVFGYDIIIDEDLKCWLLEVNSSPSLEKDFFIDEVVKQQLIDDTMEVVSPVDYDRSRLREVVERRRKECEGLKSHVNFHNNSTEQLNLDLEYLLHGQKLRKYGQAIESLNYTCLAPGPIYDKVVAAVQRSTLDPIVKRKNFY